MQRKIRGGRSASGAGAVAATVAVVVKMNSFISFNLKHLEDIPVEIMPRVLAFLQGKDILFPNAGLNSAFACIREVSMRLALHKPHQS